MTSLLPVVAHDTATSAICDIIREEMDGDPDKCLLAEWMLQIAAENPAVLMAANTLLAGSPEREKSAGLMGMAITYRTLSAQAEIAALNKMLPVYPQNDRCQSCGTGKAEHDFSEIHKGKLETLKLCADCLHAEDGCTDVNADLEAGDMDPHSIKAYRAELATLSGRLPEMSRDEFYSALQIMSIRLVA